MKQNRSAMFVLIVLIFASLACGLFSGGDGEEGDAPQADLPAVQESVVEEDVDAPQVDLPAVQEATSAPEIQPGYEPGWRIFSNANFVNGIAVHEGVLWAATEGGVIAWDLENDQAVKHTPLDGLGHISAYDVVICPMPDPRMVVATEMGLSLFDPASGLWDTTPITPEDSHVATSKISKLFCDSENGRLLIGYSGIGFLDIASGAWQRYVEDDGLARNGIDSMTTVGTEVWVVGYKGISVISDQGIQIYNEETGMPDESAQGIATGPDGTVWVGSDAGLLRFQQGNMSVFDTDSVDGFPSGRLKTVSIASDGTVWVANSGNKLCQFDPSQESCIYTYEGNTEHYLTDMAAGDAGDVYYSTYGGGIWAYNGSEWRNLFLQEDQLVGNFVEAFAEDQNGMLWVATDNGAQRIDPNNLEAPWETFRAGEDGPPSSWFQGVYPGPSSVIWFSHDSKRASSYDESTWSRYGEDAGIIGSINAIAFDKDGTPYLGTSEGLLILGGASHTLLTDADGLPSKIVRSLVADGDIMWVGTTKGLARLENLNVETVLDSNSPGLPDDNISVIVKESDSSLLLGTPGGLARFDGDQVITLLEPEGKTGLFGSNQSISSIAIDLDGSLWIGTYVGLYHGDGQNWEHLDTTDGLPTNNINAVYVDSSGVVWVGGGFTKSGGGVARYIPGETVGGDSLEPDLDQSNSQNSDGQLQYDQNTDLPLFPDAEQVYSTDIVLNYWSGADLASLRQFYFVEMANIGWLLDVDENGDCLDDDRCMGWQGDYADPSTQTFFFLKGEKGYLTMNLIPEDNQINVVVMINEPSE